MIPRAEANWNRPDNKWLRWVLCLGQALLIALPALWAAKYVWLLSASLVVLGLALFSVQRTLLLLILLNIVLPDKVLLALRLPGGLTLQEGFFAMALVFALIDLIYWRGLSVRTSAGDLPTSFFLGVAVFSALVGALHYHSTSLILRDLRFPLYYAVFFLVTNFADKGLATRGFLPVLVMAALVVSTEYTLEFLGSIDLSVGANFVRIARLEGLALPLALLFILNQFIHDPQRYGRPLLAGLFLCIGLGFVLTMGRGMWVAFAVGLLTTVWLHHLSQPETRRNLWRTVSLAIGTLAILVATAFFFQRLTGASIGAHALERSRSFVDYERDVHLLGRLFSYGVALQEIAHHPLLGNGQGATLVIMLFSEDLGRFETATSWTVDNLYLTLLLKMGLLGLLAFGWLSLRILRLAYRGFAHGQDRQTRAFAGGAVAIMMAMGTLGLSDGAMVNGRFAIVFGVLYGLIAVLAQPAPDPGKSSLASS
ncbi:MAG: O-antigen ligase family protein [Candidatus Latescibacteria bacterium]|nr:O-antigen ligase family protein [Candidatus Latescibacterota bacterium]